MQRLGAEVSVSVWKYNRADPRQPCVTMRAEALQVDRRKDEAIRHCDASPRVDVTVKILSGSVLHALGG